MEVAVLLGWIHSARRVALRDSLRSTLWAARRSKAVATNKLLALR